MRTYQGSIITKTPITPSGPYQCGAASGVWTIDQMVGWQKAGLWPTAGTSFVGAIAIFALGYTCSGASTTREKYTYSGCVVTSATAASNASYGGAATGNSTIGIFALGNISFAPSTTRNKYTYSGDTNGSATASSVVSGNGSAASNGTCGVNV